MKHDRLFVLAASLLMTLPLLGVMASFIPGVRGGPHIDLGAVGSAPADGSLITQTRVRIQNTTTQRFPFYEDLVTGRRTLDLRADASLYALLGNPSSGYLPTVQNGDDLYFTNPADGRILKVPSGSDADLSARFAKTALFYDAVDAVLKREAPACSLTVYQVPDARICGAADTLGIWAPNGGAPLRALAEGLDPAIRFGTLRIDSFDDYKRFFYASDHHWSMYGAYEGYVDCLRLLRPGETPRPAGDFYTPVGCERFRGAMSRVTANPGISDMLAVTDVTLPAYDVTVNREAPPANFARGEPKGQNPFENLYDVIFHENYALVSYDFHAPGAGNLLIIADSMSNCMEALLASHFNKTHVIDLRLWKERFGADFALTDFAREHRIDRVLFLGGQTYTTEDLPRLLPAP